MPETPKTFRFITAADSLGSDLKHVEGIAYSGGTFSQWWSSAPCVTDLAGLEIAPQIPLMYNHINDPEYRLGEITVTKTETALLVSGGIDPDSEKGAAIIAAGKKCQWQLSHGADILEAVSIPEEEERRINGRLMKGPLTLIKRAILREVSVVAIGADADTSLRIAAGFDSHTTLDHKHPHEGGKTMPEKSRENLADVKAVKPDVKPETVKAEEPVLDVKAAAEAAVKAERERVAGVRAALKDCPAMIDKAISAGWSVDYCSDLAANVKAAMAGLPQATANIMVKDQPQADSSVLEAALELRAGIDEKTILAAHGEKVIEQADRMRGLSLKEALIASCRMKGINVPVTLDQDTIRAGFSTTDLPGILSNVAHKAMLKEFASYPVIATKLCSTGDLADYKEAYRLRMSDVGDLESVPVGGEVTQSTLKEEMATNKAERYAKAFWLDEALIINDDLGMFLKIPRLFGARAARHIDKVFFRRLLANPAQADGQNLFSAAHGNYLTGSTYALSLDALKTMRTLFLQQVDADGEPISIAPRFLLVPSSLEAAAQEIVQSAVLIAGSGSVRGATNIVAKWGLEVIGSPYLENTKYPGNSSTGWYMFGDPAQVDTFEIGFLKGQRTPTVERGQFDLTHFGVGYRVRFDFGIREQDHRGMTFATGVAESSSSSSAEPSSSSSSD